MPPTNPIFLSVCIPAYNEEASVANVINEHIIVLEKLQPHLSDWEIVCVDDCSTDNTLAILKDLAKANPRIRYLHHKANRGITGAFTTVFNAAKGTHIYATAADSQWPVANLEKMFAELMTGKDLVIGVRTKRYQRL